MKSILTLVFVLNFLITEGCSADFLPSDSVRKVSTQKRSNFRLTTRVHSMGLFSYGGRLVSENPVIDFNVNYDRKQWGFQVFKAFDLRDSNTPINFTLAVLNKNFHFGNKLTVTPSAGFILEQSTTIADHGSDVVLIVIAGYKLAPSLTVEYSALFGNLLLEPELRDWVNRLRLLYSNRHLDLTLSGWHNNKVFDSAEYMTLGFSAFYSRIKLSSVLTFNAGVTALIMPNTSDEVSLPKKNGVFLTLSAVFD